METMQSCITKDLYLAGDFLTLMEFVAVIICSGHGLPGYLAGNMQHLIYNNCFKKHIDSAEFIKK